MKLWKHQQYALDKYTDREFFGLLFPCGTGKEQPLSSKILTASGYTTMGDIKIGDVVLDGKGNNCNVIGIYPQGYKQVYKLTFTDGTSIRVGQEHLNRFVRHPKPVCHKCKDGKIVTVDLTTTELIRQFNSNRYNFWCELPCCKLRGDYTEVNLPLDPYLLGFLIGDGSLCYTTKGISSAEKDLIDKVSALLEKEECALRQKTTYGYDIVKKGKENKLRQKIDALGLNVLSVNKFIPKEYMFASKQDRLKLIQGLFDTDGTVTVSKKGGCAFEFSTSSKQLAEDIAFVLRTLGCVVKIIERESFYKKAETRIKAHNSYRLFIKCPNNLSICTSIKHTSKVVDRQANTPMRKLVSIELDGMEQCQCIMVDSEEHTYITDNVTVTHNTLTAIKIAEAKDRPVLIIAPNALCKQWAEEIEDKKEKDWEVVVCTSKTKKTKRFKKAFEKLCGE